MPHASSRSQMGLLSPALRSLRLGAIAAIALGGPLSLLGSAETAVNLRQPLLMDSTAIAQAETQPRFSCQVVNGQQTVMYYPKSRPNDPFAWATPGPLGGGWTPQARCTEIARRFEEYRPDGLVELQNSQLNGYNTVCVTTRENQTCRLVFTVPPGQDPITTRNSVFQNVVVADRGEQTQAVNTYTNNNRDENLVDQIFKAGRSALGIDDKGSNERGPINLLPFLDPADGGTGRGLR